MVKRFSWKTFVIVAVIHFAGTVIILVLAAHSLGLYHQGVAQSRFAFQCLMVWAWIWSPLWMALSSRYSLHAGALVLLLWSPVVGALAGFIVPRIRRRGAKHLTKRCSQPLVEKKITKVKLESRKEMRKLASASGGRALSR